PVSNHGGYIHVPNQPRRLQGDGWSRGRRLSLVRGVAGAHRHLCGCHRGPPVHPRGPGSRQSHPFGGTVAHGFLTMSLLAPMAFDAQPAVAGTVMSVNYGFDRVRLMAPVRAGSRIRGRFVLKEVVDRGPKEIMAKTQVTVEIEGGDKPALVADWFGLTRFA